MKNGGTSVYKFLRKNNIDFLLGYNADVFDIKGQHKPARDFLKEKSRMFCIVRNPYSRLVSFYNWMHRMPEYKDITFDFFVENKYKYKRAKSAWNLQKEMITDSSDKIIVHKIFYFENMEKELKDYFKINTKFPHLNKSTKIPYQNYYTEKTQNIVYEHFKEDFNLFGYEKCLT